MPTSVCWGIRHLTAIDTKTKKLKNPILKKVAAQTAITVHKSLNLSCGYALIIKKKNMGFFKNCYKKTIGDMSVNMRRFFYSLLIEGILVLSIRV